MIIPILYEDNEIMVIEKPSGVVVNRADTVKEETIQDWFRSYIDYDENAKLSTDDESREYFRQRDGLVHRLDRETSGVMVLAKNPVSFVELLRQFKEREIKKEYMALTHGIWNMKNGEITATVGRMRHNRKMFGVREDGRESQTFYEVEKEFHNWSFPKELKVDDRGYTGFALVRFSPKTGRTHQIRVHARHMGHPLVGDFLYAGRKRAREDRKWSGRILLQAQKLILYHPISHKLMEFEAKTPIFEEVLRYFPSNI